MKQISQKCKKGKKMCQIQKIYKIGLKILFKNRAKKYVKIARECIYRLYTVHNAGTAAYHATGANAPTTTVAQTMRKLT